MKRPVIGILGDWEKPEKSCFPFDRVRTNRAYVDALIQSGAYPVVLPYFDKDALSFCDGLLIQGGMDVDPSFYHEKKSPLCDKTDPKADQNMISAVLETRKTRLPLLGICRGLQIINVAFGGTLWQDMSLCPGAAKHEILERACEGVHKVLAKENTIMRQILGPEPVLVNSLHHQSVKTPAPCLKVSALAEDGTVEAMEGDNILAVQWHPEAMFSNNEKMREIFSFFVKRTLEKAKP